MVKFTIDDVSKHNTVNDCWIIIYNEVYNITEFMKKDHSGGFIPLSVAGKDATNLFIVTHPLYVKKMLNTDSIFHQKYHIGTIDKNNRNPYDDKLYFKLKKEVEKYMRKKNIKPRDILLFDFEIVFFIILTLFTYKKMLTSNKNSFIFSILHGISFTFMITRTIHDCNHGGLTKKNRWKRYLFTFINEIFSSNQSWQSKHNLHHMHTNDINKDPDMQYGNKVRLSKKYKIKSHHKFQYIYWILMYPLFSLSQIFGFRYMPNNDPEPFHKLCYFPAKFILLLYIVMSIKYGKFKYWIYSMLLSGFYLVTVFSVNHNLYYLTDNYRITNSFLTQQLSSTTDYNSGSQLTNFITHGLNHQIIHHLFPSINYHNYPILTKNVLIPFCKKHNLNYHGEKESFLKLLCIHIISLYKWRK